MAVSLTALQRLNYNEIVLTQKEKERERRESPGIISASWSFIVNSVKIIIVVVSFMYITVL